LVLFFFFGVLIAPLAFLTAISFIGVYHLGNFAYVAHCDLKPDNLLLTNEKRLKIADFNLSTTFFCDNSRHGTKLFMSPERLLSEKWVLIPFSFSFPAPEVFFSFVVCSSG
jgi:serine/threonine protein kinase